MAEPKDGQRKRRLSKPSELDVIGAVCCLYALCIASAHALLHESLPFRLETPATNPLVTAGVLLACAVLHLFGLYQLARSRSNLNGIISRIRSMRPLPPSRYNRAQASSRSTISPPFHDQADDVHDWHVVRHKIAAGLAAQGRQGARRSLHAKHLHVKMTAVTVAMTADKYFKRFFGHKGLFSQKGALYELRLLAREVVIVPIQFLSGYKLSSHVESGWIVVYGVVLALQWLVVPPLLAWNFYAVHASGDKREQIQAGRIRILLVLLAFDLVLGVAIPVLLFVPSVVQVLREDVADVPTIDHVHDLSVVRALVIRSVPELISAAITLGVIYWTLQSVCDVRRSAFLKENIAVAAKLPISAPARRSTHFKVHFRMSRMRRGSVVPTTPGKATSSPTIHDLPACYAYSRQELRAHARRRCLFQVMLAFSTLLAAALLLIVLRAALPCDMTPHAMMTCASFLRPWHVLPFFSQRCECKLLTATCARMDAMQDRDNVSDYLLSHAAQSINALSLTNCSLPHTPAIVSGLEQLPSLWFLSLTRCHGDTDAIPLNLTRFTSLLYFALHHNVFTELSLTLRDLPPLMTTLDLSLTDWSRVEWPVWVPSAWHNLQQVRLAACRLRSLPWPLLHLSSLVVLDVSSNQIDAMPHLNATTWPHLRQLDLGNNALAMAPTGVWTLPQLESLILSNNALSQCPRPARYQQLLVLTGNPCCSQGTSPFC